MNKTWRLWTEAAAGGSTLISRLPCFSIETVCGNVTGSWCHSRCLFVCFTLFRHHYFVYHTWRRLCAETHTQAECAEKVLPIHQSKTNRCALGHPSNFSQHWFTHTHSNTYTHSLSSQLPLWSPVGNSHKHQMVATATLPHHSRHSECRLCGDRSRMWSGPGVFYSTFLKKKKFFRRMLTKSMSVCERACTEHPT